MNTQALFCLSLPLVIAGYPLRAQQYRGVC